MMLIYTILSAIGAAVTGFMIADIIRGKKND